MLCKFSIWFQYLCLYWSCYCSFLPPRRWSSLKSVYLKSFIYLTRSTHWFWMPASTESTKSIDPMLKYWKSLGNLSTKSWSARGKDALCWLNLLQKLSVHFVRQSIAFSPSIQQIDSSDVCWIEKSGVNMQNYTKQQSKPAITLICVTWMCNDDLSFTTSFGLIKMLSLYSCLLDAELNKRHRTVWINFSNRDCLLFVQLFDRNVGVINRKSIAGNWD